MYVLDENKNLVENFTLDQIFDIVHPIGEIYVQYPNQNPPLELYNRGNWEDITSQYAGLFFRAEGGNSLPFQGGIQEDKIRNINGRFIFVNECNPTTTGGYGSIRVVDRVKQMERGIQQGENFNGGWGVVTYDIDVNLNIGTGANQMAGHADGPEIRPINTAVRIWKRVG